MDTTKAITHVSLCAGYGGIDLGLSRAIPSLRTVAFSEIEAFACANLVSKMEAGLLDAAPIWTNLKTFPWAEFHGRVDILSGGYPCQPFSSAGKRLGTEDPRHLWPYIADGIRAMRPRVCFFENVEGHISLGLREVVGELEEIGYKVAWGIFSAREVGAPHQRKRVFIMAHDKSQRVQRHGSDWLQESLSHARQGLPLRGGEGCKLADTSDGSDTEAGHAEAHRLPSEHRQAVCAGESGGANATAWPSRPGQPQYGWEPPRVMGDTKHNGSHQCSEETRGQITSSKQGWVQEFEGGSASVGDTSDRSNGQHTSEQQGRDTSRRSSAEGVSVGDTTNQRCGRLDDEQGEVGSRETRGHVDRAGSTMGNGNSINWSASPEGRQHDPKARSTSERQTQQSLGGDSNESTRGMDYAELCVSCDNRTDELRLLGNGVVPATAERAFRTLLAELIP
jgi:DNA-cytosine methyltransferase